MGNAIHPIIGIGERFGKLVVSGDRFRRLQGKYWRWYYPCRCDCGRTTEIVDHLLRRGHSTTCGCSHIRQASAKHVHGESNTPLHNAWRNMLQRCYNPKRPGYPFYGGRGITVCDAWRDYFVFRDWARSNGYAVGLELDRKDTNGNYEPENCRFITGKANSQNKRDTIEITAFGETKCLAEWVRDSRCKVVFTALGYRLRQGWEPERAITQSPTPHNQRYLKQ